LLLLAFLLSLPVGDKVLRVTIPTEEDLHQIKKLTQDKVDVWSRDGILMVGENDMVVSPLLEKIFASFGIQSEVLIGDLEALLDLDEQNQALSLTQNVKDSAFFDNYRRYDDIVGYTKSLNAQYPSITWWVESIGESVEGRPIPALHINATSGSDSGPTKKIYWQAGQHAREWISPPTLLWVVTSLLENYGRDQTVNRLLETFEIVIVPMCNPDGYEYSWTRDRMWRKNRKNNGNGIYGVDLNRNWDSHWGGGGSSSNPSSDTYHGLSPFSEPESAALGKYINSLRNIWGAIDFHSYSQLVLRPYGWTTANCPDEVALRELGSGISYEIRQVYQRNYVSQKSIDLYITTGTASDWFYETKANTPAIWASYTIELRDTGTYGFLLPADQIRPTGQEIYRSMLYYMAIVRDNHPLVVNNE